MRISYTSAERHAFIASILYLSIPIAIFLSGWTRYSIGIPTTVLLACAVLSSIKATWRHQKAQAPTPEESISVSSLLFGMGIIVVIVCVSGSGGWGYQDWDWEAHRARLHDLIVQPWPVIFSIPEGKVLMVYYMAYYLPAACIGKLWGWQIANHVLFLTTLSAVVLSYLWVVILSKAHPFLCSAIFLFFSGMDIIGNFLLNHSLGGNHIEWWTRIGQYSSNITLIFWQPHQGPPGWLITALFIFLIKVDMLPRIMMLLASISCLWTVFASIGLAPLLASVAVIGFACSRYRLQDFVSIENSIGTIIMSIFIIYFSAHLSHYDLPMAITQLPQGEFRINFSLNRQFLLTYILFAFLEFMVLHAIIYFSLYSKAVTLLWYQNTLFISSTFVLILLPLFYYGYFNDLVMRASIPALFVTMLTAIISTRQLYYGKTNRGLILLTMFTFVLALGSFTSMIEIRRHFDKIFQSHSLIDITPFGEVKTLIEVQQSESYNIIGQYIGSADCWFTRYIMRGRNSSL